MINPPLANVDLLDWEALTPEGIDLLPEHVHLAVQLSQTVADPEFQWQTYLNALATFGFEQWVAERATELAVDRDRCTLMQPSAQSLLNATSNVQVGEFNVCLIAVGSVLDNTISIHSATIDSADWTPHFYVLVEVLEEQEQIKVYGYLRRDELLRHQQTQTLAAEPDLTYALPLNWFTADPETLMLELRCLSPEAIARSISEFTASAAASTASISTSAGTVAASSAHSAFSTPQPLQALTQQAINAGLWLCDRLDQAAAELSWVLVPAFVPAASAMRSAVEELQRVTEELERSGIDIVPEARGAYRDVRWGSIGLRLYALVWALPMISAEAAPEWSLLLVLGGQPGVNLPVGSGLRVQDEIQVLVERSLTTASQDTYLYARVIGTWNEQFWVTVTLPNGVVVTLPPFAFNPDSVS